MTLGEVRALGSACEAVRRMCWRSLQKRNVFDDGAPFALSRLKRPTPEEYEEGGAPRESTNVLGQVRRCQLVYRACEELRSILELQLVSTRFSPALVTRKTATAAGKAACLE